MKRTHLASFSRRDKTQEGGGDEDGEGINGEINNSNKNHVLMNHYKNYEAGLIPWPPKNYTCSFCRREFKSAQALGGHMNVHRRDRARLRQIPSWLFESHHLPIPIPTPNPNPNPNPNPKPNLTLTSSSSTTPSPHQISLTQQRSKTASYEGFTAREKRKSNMETYELSGEDNLMNNKDEVLGFDALRNPKQVLDLELRLGYL